MKKLEDYLYYEERDPDLKIYCGDCLEILPLLPKVDLVVTDPPYGMNWQSNTRVKLEKYDPIVGDDDSFDFKNVMEAILKTLKHSRHLYVFGDFSFDGIKVGATSELIWDKGRMSAGNLYIPWGKAHEKITFAYKDKGRLGNGSLSARLRRGSILRYDRPDGNNSVHPTEKPVRLLQELIESSSRFGETVLDPFMGCGSTLLAARLEGRNCIGIEISEKYCEIAKNRLKP